MYTECVKSRPVRKAEKEEDIFVTASVYDISFQKC